MSSHFPPPDEISSTSTSSATSPAYPSTSFTPSSPSRSDAVASVLPPTSPVHWPLLWRDLPSVLNLAEASSSSAPAVRDALVALTALAAESGTDALLAARGVERVLCVASRHARRDAGVARAFFGLVDALARGGSEVHREVVRCGMAAMCVRFLGERWDSAVFVDGLRALAALAFADEGMRALLVRAGVGAVGRRALVKSGRTGDEALAVAALEVLSRVWGDEEGEGMGVQGLREVLRSCGLMRVVEVDALGVRVMLIAVQGEEGRAAMLKEVDGQFLGVTAVTAVLRRCSRAPVKYVDALRRACAVVGALVDKLEGRDILPALAATGLVAAMRAALDTATTMIKARSPSLALASDSIDALRRIAKTGGAGICRLLYKERCITSVLAATTVLSDSRDVAIRACLFTQQLALSDTDACINFSTTLDFFQEAREAWLHEPEVLKAQRNCVWALEERERKTAPPELVDLSDSALSPWAASPPLKAMPSDVTQDGEEVVPIEPLRSATLPLCKSSSNPTAGDNFGSHRRRFQSALKFSVSRRHRNQLPPHLRLT